MGDGNKDATKATTTAANSIRKRSTEEEEEEIDLKLEIPEKRKQRTRFTEEEVEAIKLGIDTCGVGNWIEIKREYPVLNGRTNVQIKDKYRNMKKNGEI